VAILSNDWRTLSKNVAALEDRGHVVFFEPSPAEVHAQAGTWFDNPEIYAWLAANPHRIRQPSLRIYMRARELKAAGMNWTEILERENENRRERLAAELLGSSAYNSMEAQAAAFVAKGGRCRATFYNYRRKLGSGTGHGSRSTSDRA
jgi:hypothetical protein